MADTCRTCGAALRWAVTPNGKRMPLDAKEVLVAEVQGEDIVRMVRGHVSHFATCPGANAHRGKPRGGESHA